MNSPVYIMTDELTLKSLISIKEGADTPPAIVHHQPSKSPENIQTHSKLNNAYVLVATLWGEARGEGYEGMQAVMNVIMNRAKGNFDNAVNVVLKPKQFSIWNNVENPQEKSQQLVQQARNKELKDLKQYTQAVDIVNKAMKGELKDITGGATFYFNPSLANPSWAKKLQFLKKIGNHDFYGIPTK